jgi:hypothetical protein
LEFSVLAARKPSRFTYYVSLPLVIVIVLLLVAKLAALQRADLIAELAERVAHRDAASAAEAVRQLAAMPRPPVEILVSAVASADREVAEEAKRAIGRVLRGAQRRIENEQGLSRVAPLLGELAESLAVHQPMIAPTDHPWLFRTTRKVLRLANRIQGPQTPLVATHCDAILAAITPTEPPAERVADQGVPRNAGASSEGAMVNHLREARQVVPDTENIMATPTAAMPMITDRHPAEDRLTEAKPPAIAAEDEILKSPWRATWSHPMFRIVPAMPIQAAPVQGEPALPTEPAVDIQPIETGNEPNERPLAGLDSRELLRQWLSADGRNVFPLEEELTYRGFGRLSERLVQQLFSDNAEDRLRLIDDALTEPGIDGRPWLVLLAEDADADVRLLAVTIMATSNDAALIEKAWQVSIHDRDPRVAGLAGRLRERREGILRR